MFRMPSVHSSPCSTCWTMSGLATRPTSVGQVWISHHPAAVLEANSNHTPSRCGPQFAHRRRDLHGVQMSQRRQGMAGLAVHDGMQRGVKCFQSSRDRTARQSLARAGDIPCQAAIAVQGLQCVLARQSAASPGRQRVAQALHTAERCASHEGALGFCGSCAAARTAHRAVVPAGRDHSGSRRCTRSALLSRAPYRSAQQIAGQVWRRSGSSSFQRSSRSLPSASVPASRVGLSDKAPNCDSAFDSFRRHGPAGYPPPCRPGAPAGR